MLGAFSKILADRAVATQNCLPAVRVVRLGAALQYLYPYHQRVAKVRQLLGISDALYPGPLPASAPLRRRSCSEIGAVLRRHAAIAGRNHVEEFRATLAVQPARRQVLSPEKPCPLSAGFMPRSSPFISCRFSCIVHT